MIRLRAGGFNNRRRRKVEILCSILVLERSDRFAMVELTWMTTTIQEAFRQLRTNLEPTGLRASIVSERQANIRKVIEGNMDVIDSFLTGAYLRSTMIAPLEDADIDLFVVLDPKYYHGYNGQNGGQAGLLDLLKRTLRRTYASTPEISRNGQAVTIWFSDFLVDVVPGFYRDGGGFLIPNSITGTWLATDPKKHVDRISASNKAHDGDLVPLCKMIKGWNKSHGSFFRSFHLEVLALQILNGVKILDFPSGARFYFDKARALIKQQTADPAGYGDDVGKYLMHNNVEEAEGRFQLSYDRAVEAEQYAADGHVKAAVEMWRKIFGDYFPAYG
jgi:hypothetical protein